MYLLMKDKYWRKLTLLGRDISILRAKVKHKALQLRQSSVVAVNSVVRHKI